MKKAIDELQELFAHSTLQFHRLMFQIGRAMLSNSMKERETALTDLSDMISKSMILANLIGRKRLLMESDRMNAKSFEAEMWPVSFEIETTPVVPHIPFDEAITDILSREPRLAFSYEAVQELYSREHAFAMAKSTDMVITKRIQGVIEKFLKEGKSVDDASKIISEIGDFSRAYSETVYRTNIATAYTDGRIAEADHPDVRDTILAFEVVGVADVDERPNHGAARGFIAGVKDTIWAEGLRPPYGYNCRHGLRPVSIYELERLGLLMSNNQVKRYYPSNFSQAHRDPGFSISVI